MLQRAYAANLKFKPFNNIKPSSYSSYSNYSNKYFDYLSEWYSPLEIKPGAKPPRKWCFKII
jgi:hypothetical protein